MAVKIVQKEFTPDEQGGGIWSVQCYVDLADGTRSGIETLSIPETATDAELCTAIEALYTQPEV